jgi:hypothetical protein
LQVNIWNNSSSTIFDMLDTELRKTVKGYTFMMGKTISYNRISYPQRGFIIQPRATPPDLEHPESEITVKGLHNVWINIMLSLQG